MEDIIVLYPSVGSGHLFSMVELGKLLITYQPSISITIIIPILTNETDFIDSYITGVSATTSSINFIRLPPTTALSNLTSSSFRDTVAFFYELPQLNNPKLHQTLVSLSKSSNIKGLIIDFFCIAAVQVSSTLNIPIYYFCPSGASSLCLLLHCHNLDKEITKDLKDVDTLIDCPGLPSLLSKDLPLVLLDRSHRVYQYSIDTSIKMASSAGIIVNTFESLESTAVKAIVEGRCTPDEPPPPLYCIGPLVKTKDTEIEHECLTWLDSQPAGSVVFLCFGSMGVFSGAQLKEMAIGLEKSEVRFLWVVRNPPADDESNGTLNLTEPDLEVILPEGFLDRTKDKGLVVKMWAPQIAVLNHSSVGGFVTHCGWNSILESVCAGLPMLAWPLYAEQKINRVALVQEMKLALTVTETEEGLVTATEFEQRLSELMNTVEGKEIRERVTAVKGAAEAALRDGGSSRAALAQLLHSFHL